MFLWKMKSGMSMGEWVVIAKDLKYHAQIIFISKACQSRHYIISNVIKSLLIFLCKSIYTYVTYMCEDSRRRVYFDI